MNATIQQMIQTITNMSNDVNEGVESPFVALALLKELDVELKEAIKFTTKVAVEEAQHYDKTFVDGEHTFTKVNGRRVFNFKEIPDWVEQKKTLSEIETKHKQAFNQYEKGLRMVDENGEIVQPALCTFTNDTISVKLYSNQSTK